MAKTATKKTSAVKQTKSAAIRAYMAEHRSAGPTAVSKALKEKGIDVSPAHVSNVKQASNKRKRGGRKAKVVRYGHASAKADAISLAHLVEARRFAKQVGGVDSAVNVLQSLKTLLS